MTSSELMLALSRTLKEAANEQESQDEYRRGQLLSASSLARHLAAEQSSEPELWSWFRSRMLALLEDASGRAASLGDEALGGRLRECRRRLEQATDRGVAGQAISELLAELRARGDSSREFRAEMQSLLRALCDREVAALAHPT